MNQIMIDIAILVVLVLFAIWGLHRGLVRSLCSLLAVLIAFVGALLVSSHFSAPVANWIQPVIQPPIESAIQAALPENLTDTELPLNELMILLSNAELPMDLDEHLAALQESGATVLTTDSLIEELSSSLSAKIANTIAKIVLFLLSFLLILLIWHLLTRTLDLVAHLPGLNFLNKLGGFVFGALQGFVLLFICAWLIRWLWSDLIPAEIMDGSKLVHFFMTFDPLAFLAKL